MKNITRILKRLWCVDEVKTDEPVKSAEFARSSLGSPMGKPNECRRRFLLDRFSDSILLGAQLKILTSPNSGSISMV